MSTHDRTQCVRIYMFMSVGLMEAEGCIYLPCMTHIGLPRTFILQLHV